MALIDLKTDLKSLKFGRDRVGGGSSNQPFVQKPIPDSMSQIGQTGGYDSLVRGGTLTIGKTADDVSRLTKLLLTPKTIQGPLFTAKQNFLSRLNVKTQASPQTGLNQGPYLTSSTIAQAGLEGFGGHLTTFGKNARLGGLGSLVTYSDKVKTDQSQETNRLVGFYNRFTKANENNPILQTYIGGPGAELGVGVTNINFASVRTPIPMTQRDFSKYTIKTVTNQGIRASATMQVPNLGIDTNTLFSASLKNGTLFNQILGLSDDGVILPKFNVNSAQDTAFDTLPQPSTLWTKKQIEQASPQREKAIAKDPRDFRKETSLKEQAPDSNFYRNATYQLGNPGYKNINRNVDPATSRAPGRGTDRINFTKIEGESPAYKGDDLIPFYIQMLNYDETINSVQFRAFIDSFSDSFNSEWNSFRYMGRGENFYTYDGFTREVSLSFSIHAQSKAELIPQYTRLNYLASLTAPNYSSAGYMRGNFVKLTVGDYLMEVPGIITGMSITVPMESPWDIGRKNDGSRTDQKDRLPHLVQVSNFTFKPIHDFIPSINQPFISATLS